MARTESAAAEFPSGCPRPRSSGVRSSRAPPLSEGSSAHGRQRLGNELQSCCRETDRGGGRCTSRTRGSLRFQHGSSMKLGNPQSWMPLDKSQVAAICIGVVRIHAVQDSAGTEPEMRNIITRPRRARSRRSSPTTRTRIPGSEGRWVMYAFDTTYRISGWPVLQSNTAR